MTLCIFTGPTLSVAEARKVLAAEYLPPAAIGDVYKAALRRPQAIGIIDGFFESTPSVWHKEVLWAMAQGIHVYGAASMGALRAAELAPLGMVGVGEIFKAYRDGLIEDDDEVAVVHGPPELGYPQLSEAMVNIRSTLRLAVAEGIVTLRSETILLSICKSLFYKNRTYERLIAMGREQGLPAADADRLSAWLPGHAINQKRLDALALLRAIADRESAPPMQVDYVFEQTTAWEAVERHFAPSGLTAAAIGDGREGLLEELRLGAGAYEQARQEALLRLLAGREADRQGFRPTVESLQAAIRAFRQVHGIETPEELDAWLDRQALGRDDFLRLMEDQARLQALEQNLGDAATAAIPDQLRLSGDYAELAARARLKQEALHARGLNEPTLADAGLSEAGLMQWFLDLRGLPADMDAGVVAQRLGFEDYRDFLRAVIREYCYRRQRDS